MNEEERKQMAYLAGMLYKLAIDKSLTMNELVSLDNIAGTLGFYQLDEREFRW